MDMIVHYDQETTLAPSLGEMDTTPILRLLNDEILQPPFMPPVHPELVHPAALPMLLPSQEQNLSFLSNQPELAVNGFSPSMHLSISDLPMPVFMNAAMESSLDPLSTTPFDMGLVTDPFAMVSSSEVLDVSPSDVRTLSASPPQSQVPSPSVHGTSSSYGAGVTSSLESALDPVPTHGGRSRANTSLSPPSSFPSLSPPSLHNGATEYPTSISSGSSTSALEESISHQQPQTLIGKLLKDIAITAIDAGDAFEHCHGPEQTTKVGELKDRIEQVMQMLKTMTVNGSEPHSYAIATPVPTVHPQPTIPLFAPPFPPSDNAVESNHLAVSDQSRKRCASELEEHRSVKALKREPQDDTPLILTMQDAATPPAASLAFPPSTTYPVVPAVPVVPKSRPPSRPPTPPSAFVANNSFGTIKQQPSGPAATPAFIPGTPAAASLPLNTAISPPAFHNTWSDPIVPTRHHHSLSAGSVPGPLTNLGALATVPSSSPFAPIGLQAPVSQPLTNQQNGGTPTIGRMSRSGSISGTNFRNLYNTFSYSEQPYSDAATSAYHGQKVPSSSSRGGGSQSNWRMGSEAAGTSSSTIATKRTASFSINAPSHSHNSPSDDEDDEDDSDSDESTSGKTVSHHGPGDRQSASAASELPAEYLFDVDRIFFEFLNKLCSNLDATDAKGEQIHQTLMAKKMQRLDESPDFRPFKFRIQAFTNSFMDELVLNGYNGDKIPMKKARNYLWRQKYILRFNEDGKKAKSKGNHIWNVEAKKTGEGQWEFRPFQRKLAGNPPNVAYCGLRWSWKPHIWHPQCSFKKIPVTYSSPNLPSWLTWKGGELSGTPPPDAVDCQITAIAKFALDNKEDQVSMSFSISIAPVSALDSVTYSRSRRPSFAGEPPPPKRSTSDSALFQIPQRADSRITRMDDTRVIRVLQNVALRVTTEAESQFVSQSPPKEGKLQDLVKQKHVLEQTVHAYDKAISGKGHMDSRRLAVAAQHVVLQAAQTVIADRTVASGGVPVPQTETVAIQSVSVNELTDKTQDAIAQAVKINGTGSNEVDIIVKATSILKAQTPVLDTAAAAAAAALPPPPRGPPSAVAPSRIASTFPLSNLSPLPEYT
ncbi:hypothetical protein CVT25_006515 [Psilocybe cyanescens]|uniref:Uncharacterized protein n=1 Tax=Psilocybe cyanescens TaxID=93625 RepID=A0A409XED0_PSICY|nr:hypothetical protein CVT25_006515 [Psilocybe cyanescens]